MGFKMALRTYRLAFIGFGTVGQGAAELLHERAETLRAEHGFQAQIVGVYTPRRGSLYDPNGLDIPELLIAAEKGTLSTYPQMPTVRDDLDVQALIRETNANVIIEVTPTDLMTGGPALDHFRLALASSKHLITANKGPVALAFQEMNRLAREKGVYFGYEGTVMGGTPALHMVRESLAGCTISAVRGIVNSTTNYILTQMEVGLSYNQALAEAQRAGYAETDPRGDVEGFDAAGKAAILANVAFGADVKPADVECTGITELTSADVDAARQSGQRWKLLASVIRRSDGSVAVRVAPERLPLSDPLAQVNGTTNALTFETDLLGPVTLIGTGAGRRGTGFAILADLIDLDRRFGMTP